MFSFDITNTNKMDDYLRKLSKQDLFSILNHYGQRGVDALANATPIDTSLTANSWRYRIERKSSGPTLVWYNTNVVDGRPIVIMLQYGHGTGTGGWVEGRDFINPVIQPLFDEIATELWRQVTNG